MPLREQLLQFSLSVLSAAELAVAVVNGENSSSLRFPGKNWSLGLVANDTGSSELTGAQLSFAQLTGAWSETPIPELARM